MPADPRRKGRPAPKLDDGKPASHDTIAWIAYDNQSFYAAFYLDTCVNALSIQADSINTGQDEDYTFDTVWKSEGRLTPDGFVILLSIPFRSLRFPQADAQTSDIALARLIPAQIEASSWRYYTNRIEVSLRNWPLSKVWSEFDVTLNPDFSPVGRHSPQALVESRLHRASRQKSSGLCRWNASAGIHLPCAELSCIGLHFTAKQEASNSWEMNQIHWR